MKNDSKKKLGLAREQIKVLGARTGVKAGATPPETPFPTYYHCPAASRVSCIQ
jgi:hypothetical protein